MASCSLLLAMHRHTPPVPSARPASWGQPLRSHCFLRPSSSSAFGSQEGANSTSSRTTMDGSLGICSQLSSSFTPQITGGGRQISDPEGRKQSVLSRSRTRGSVVVLASAQEGIPGRTKAAKLRELLAAPGIHQGPACHDALSARLVEMAGFDFAFMSGFAVSAARLGLPDSGLISYGEMVDQGRLIASAVSIPVIGDGDNGYGNAMNVKRTLQGYAQAGFAGILIEDQVSPKACGHTAGRKVLPRAEAVMKIKAAVDARNEGGYDILIVARTDARQAASLEEALWRSRAFAEAGADILFVDALASKQEMIDFCNTAPSVPKMANMLEGGGRTPILSPDELATIGFKIVAYPLSLVGVSIRAMQDALSALKSGRLPPPSMLPTFDEIKAVVGFPEYYAEEARYAVASSPEPPGTSSGAPIDADWTGSEQPGPGRGGFASSAPSQTGFQWVDGPQDQPASVRDLNDGGADSRSAERRPPPPSSERIFAGAEGAREVVEADVIKEEGEYEEPLKGPLASRYASSGSSRTSGRSLRLKVTDSGSTVKLNAVVPAAFIDGVATIIPGVAGLNLRAMLEETGGTNERTILDIRDKNGDRIQITLE